MYKGLLISGAGAIFLALSNVDANAVVGIALLIIGYDFFMEGRASRQEDTQEGVSMGE